MSQFCTQDWNLPFWQGSLIHNVGPYQLQVAINPRYPVIGPFIGAITPFTTGRSPTCIMWIRLIECIYCVHWCVWKCWNVQQFRVETHVLYGFLKASKPSKLLNVQSLSIVHMTTFLHLLTTKFRIYKNGVPGRYMCNGTRASQSYSNCLKINVFGSLGSTLYQSHAIYNEQSYKSCVISKVYA